MNYTDFDLELIKLFEEKNFVEIATKLRGGSPAAGVFGNVPTAGCYQEDFCEPSPGQAQKFYRNLKVTTLGQSGNFRVWLNLRAPRWSSETWEIKSRRIQWVFCYDTQTQDCYDTDIQGIQAFQDLLVADHSEHFESEAEAIAEIERKRKATAEIRPDIQNQLDLLSFAWTTENKSTSIAFSYEGEVVCYVPYRNLNALLQGLKEQETGDFATIQKMLVQLVF